MISKFRFLSRKRKLQAQETGNLTMIAEIEADQGKRYAFSFWFSKWVDIHAFSYFRWKI